MDYEIELLDHRTSDAVDSEANGQKTTRASPQTLTRTVITAADC